MKHVIIGAGVAGISLAYHLQKLNKKDEIIIIDKDYFNGTSYHSNNLYFIGYEKNKKFSLSIEKISPIFLFHVILIQIFFYLSNKNMNDYFSQFNFLPLTKKKCKNIQYYGLQKYRDFVDTFPIQKNTFLNYRKKRNGKFEVILKNHSGNNIICDYLYICTAQTNLFNTDSYIPKFILNNHFLLNVSTDSIYVRVDKVTINCLIRDGIYWIMPIKKNIIKISMHLYINFSKKEKKEIDIDKIIDILNSYKMKFIKIEEKWYGLRSCSYDLLPFYYEKEKNVFIITGGSFLGFNTLPAIAKEISHKVNKKKMNNFKYDLTINRIYKKMIVIYLIITLFIKYFITKFYINK